MKMALKLSLDADTMIVKKKSKDENLLLSGNFLLEKGLIKCLLWSFTPSKNIYNSKIISKKWGSVEENTNVKTSKQFKLCHLWQIDQPRILNFNNENGSAEKIW